MKKILITISLISFLSLAISADTQEKDKNQLSDLPISAETKKDSKEKDKNQLSDLPISAETKKDSKEKVDNKLMDLPISAETQKDSSKNAPNKQLAKKPKDKETCSSENKNPYLIGRIISDLYVLDLEKGMNYPDFNAKIEDGNLLMYFISQKDGKPINKTWVEANKPVMSEKSDTYYAFLYGRVPKKNTKDFSMKYTQEKKSKDEIKQDKKMSGDENLLALPNTNSKGKDIKTPNDKKDLALPSKDDKKSENLDVLPLPPKDKNNKQNEKSADLKKDDDASKANPIPVLPENLENNLL